MTAPTPWKLVPSHYKDTGPFIVDATGQLVDVRRDKNGQLIVDAVNCFTEGMCPESKAAA